MTVAIAVAIGAALGAAGRYLALYALRSYLSLGAVWGVLIVNATGSFVLGWAAARGLAGETIGFLGVGFCGAFTTFSSLSLELWEAVRDRRWREATMNAAASIVIGIGLAWLGWQLAAT